MHTYNIFKNHFLYILFLLGLALGLRFGAVVFLDEEHGMWVRLAAIAVVLWVGSAYVLTGIAHIIEETTEVLSKRTKLAGGFLQSFGTAIPDMALGVAAAILSFRLRISGDFSAAVNYAVIAAATTFGSNIYNMGHASWCIFRQNLANKLGRNVMMIPGTDKGGVLQPMSNHKLKPNMAEIDTAIDVSTALTVLTACVALGMVIFGRVSQPVEGITGDLYQLAKPIGFAVAALCVVLLYFFRGNKRSESPEDEIVEGEQYYRKQKSHTIWIHLLISAGAILLTAEAMVRAVESFAMISGIPFVVAGILAGCMGCLEEMIVVHNFSVHPNGRIGDAVVGVAMDNIITILGASVIAIMGGIFLGGNALILIFVIILTLNSILVWQISRLKNYFCTMGNATGK